MTPSSLDDVSSPPEEIGAARAAAAARMPESIHPMLATVAREPFDSTDHIFELMWGGLRAMAHVRDGVVHLRARNGRDLTPYFPELLCIPDRLRARWYFTISRHPAAQHHLPGVPPGDPPIAPHRRRRCAAVSYLQAILPLVYYRAAGFLYEFPLVRFRFSTTHPALIFLVVPARRA